MAIWILFIVVVPTVACNIEERVNVLEQEVRTQTLQIAFWEQDFATFKTNVAAALNGITQVDDQDQRPPSNNSMEHEDASQMGLDQIEGKLAQLSKAFIQQKEHLNKLADNVSRSFQPVVTEIEQKTSECENQISSFQHEVADMVAGQARYDKGLNDIETMMSQLHRFNYRLQETSTELQQNKLTVTTMEKNLHSLRNLITDAANKSNSMGQVSSDMKKREVAFSIGMNENSKKILDPWETIIFDRVITNIGNCYSKHTGTFTAPARGIYVFFVNILGYVDNNVIDFSGTSNANEFSLKQNNNNILWLSTQASFRQGTDSNFIVIELAHGDKIKVVKHGPWQHRPTNVHNSWSTFSGYMLFPVS